VIKKLAKSAYAKYLSPTVQRLFFRDLIVKTKNFDNVSWLGNPIWQNVLDLWTMQEVIARIRPTVILETGSNRGGSALFYADLMEMMKIDGRIVTVDIEKLHNHTHPRVTYLIGSSLAPEVVEVMTQAAKSSSGPVLVVLDSDHSALHVLKELKVYAPLVTPGSYCLCQDGVIDVLPMFRNSSSRPGPLVAIQDYLKTSNDFVVDRDLCDRWLITQHPMGWLQRKSGTGGEA
jgi:cephalosporin hydroxylase